MCDEDCRFKPTPSASGTDLARMASAPSVALMAECDPARCQTRIRQLIGKHEIKNEELERQEEDLHRRLQMLECSVPAVMVWQACRTEAGPEEAFRNIAKATENAGCECRSSPSCHYDCRVREIEAQRKEACRRAEKARTLWLEREAALQGKKARVELARQQQEERKERIERLTTESRKLVHQFKAPASGECTDGKLQWLDMVESEVSLGSGDLECLGRLEALAEADSCLRRRITELEAKEETYMRVLAQADELCRADRSAGDCALKAELEACCAELARYRGVERGDKCTEARPETVSRCAGRRPKCVDRHAQGEGTTKCDAQVYCGGKPRQTCDQTTDVGLCTEDKESSTEVESACKEVSATVDSVSVCTGSFRGEASKSVSVKPQASDETTETQTPQTDAATSPDEVIEESQKKPEPETSGKSGCITERAKTIINIPRSKVQASLCLLNEIHKNTSCCPQYPRVYDEFQDLKDILATALGLDSYMLDMGDDEEDRECCSRPTCFSKPKQTDCGTNAECIVPPRKKTVSIVTEKVPVADKGTTAKDVSKPPIIKPKVELKPVEQKSVATQPSKTRPITEPKSSESKKVISSPPKPKPAPVPESKLLKSTPVPESKPQKPTPVPESKPQKATPVPESKPPKPPEKPKPEPAKKPILQPPPPPPQPPPPPKSPEKPKPTECKQSPRPDCATLRDKVHNAAKERECLNKTTPIPPCKPKPSLAKLECGGPPKVPAKAASSIRIQDEKNRKKEGGKSILKVTLPPMTESSTKVKDSGTKGSPKSLFRSRASAPTLDCGAYSSRPIPPTVRDSECKNNTKQSALKTISYLPKDERTPSQVKIETTDEVSQCKSKEDGKLEPSSKSPSRPTSKKSSSIKANNKPKPKPLVKKIDCSHLEPKKPCVGPSTSGKTKYKPSKAPSTLPSRPPSRTLSKQPSTAPSRAPSKLSSKPSSRRTTIKKDVSCNSLTTISERKPSKNLSTLPSKKLSRPSSRPSTIKKDISACTSLKMISERVDVIKIERSVVAPGPSMTGKTVPGSCTVDEYALDVRQELKFTKCEEQSEDRGPLVGKSHTITSMGLTWVEEVRSTVSLMCACGSTNVCGLMATGAPKDHKEKVCICEPLVRKIAELKRRRQQRCEQRRRARQRRQPRWAIKRHYNSWADDRPNRVNCACMTGKSEVCEAVADKLPTSETDCCDRCGSPMRENEGSAAGEPAATKSPETAPERIEEMCSCCTCGDEGAPIDPKSSQPKRDQGVLAKLPKKLKTGCRQRKRPTLEVLFDGATRKVADFLEGMTTRKAKPTPGPSCTCLGQCRCGETN